MTTSKKLVAFVIFPLLFLSLIILTLITSEIEISQGEKIGHNDVDPNGHLHLTVDAEFDTIHIEAADQPKPRVDIAFEKRWTSRGPIFQPKSPKWIREMLKDLEFTIKHDHSNSRSNTQIGGRFKRGREHWQEGLKWLTVEVRVTVPRQYNVTLKTVSHGDIHIWNPVE